MHLRINVKNHSFAFPGGERHVKLGKAIDLIQEKKTNSSSSKDWHIKVLSKIRNSDDLMDTLLTISALRSALVDRPIELILPYLPYARQDRITEEGEPLSIRVLAQLIQAVDTGNSSVIVSVIDPHSDVSLACFQTVQVIPTHQVVKEVAHKINTSMIPASSELVLISPDAGAFKKIYKTAHAIGFEGSVLTAQKERDTKTGAITGTSINGNVRGKACLILDDICDGGMTFIKLAEELKKQGAIKVFLYVSHGIFSKGFAPLYDNLDGVFTLNSYYSQLEYAQLDGYSPDFVHVSVLDEIDEQYYI